MELIKLYAASVLFVLLCSLHAGAAGVDFRPGSSEESYIPEDFELEVKLRMRKMECIVTPRLNDEVKFYLNRYIFKHQLFTGKMLGKAALYFPVFEKLLREKELPLDLRALSILESWLDPAATSHVGAGGLWQLMPQTARLYGLVVDRHIDERRDLYKSTEAALSLLGRLYQMYKDWGLALAAYNAGPLRVNNAIKRAGGDVQSFWTIAPYLPRETQNFVPKFIAVNYLLNFYADHGIHPKFPELDLQFIDMTRVYQRMSFREIEAVTGVEESLLRELNPGYRGKFIPARKSGLNLVLPSRVLPTFNNYLDLPDAKERKAFLKGIEVPEPEEEQPEVLPSIRYVETIYQVEEGDDMDYISYKYHVNKTRIKLWNHLRDEHLAPGQELTLFIPLQIYLDKIAMNSEPAICIDMYGPMCDRSGVKQSGAICPVASAMDVMVCSRQPGGVYHQVRVSESLWDLAHRYGYKDPGALLALNGLQDAAELRPGMKLKVAE